MQQDPTLAFLISQGFSNTILERFWPKVSKHGPIPERCPELGPCWLWIAGTDIFGYGIIAIGGHRKGHERCGVAAHRVSWMIRFGVIPEKVCVLHKCDNPPCVNPDHLFLGTKGDNWRDMLAKGRQVVTCRKLTDEQAREVLNMVGIMPISELAIRFNVSEGTILNIGSHRYYKHLHKQKPGKPFGNPGKTS